MTRTQRWLLFATATLTGLVAAVFSFVPQSASLMFAGVLALAALAVLYVRPTWGIILIALTYPFTTLELVFGGINAPWVDIIALGLLAVFVLRYVVAFLQTGRIAIRREEWPGFWLYALFILVAIASAFNTDFYYVGLSAKYVLRPLIFLYLAWVVVPLHFIHTKELLRTLLQMMFWMGVALGIVGIGKFLLFDETEGLRRALPIDIFGYYPMGRNHNLLSEMLVGVLPFGYAFYRLEKDIFMKYIYLVATFVVGGAAFLTFSRSGWLAMMTAAAVMTLVIYRKEIKERLLPIVGWIGAVLVLPVMILLYLIQTSVIVQGSNVNRLKLIDISLELFKGSPFVGAGPGTFIYHVEQVQAYIIDFGAALDMHSMFFKVLAETGALGVIAFFAFVAYLAWRVYQGLLTVQSEEMRWLLAALTASVCGLFVFENFGTSYFIAKLWFPVGLLLAGLRISQSKKTI